MAETLDGLQADLEKLRKARVDGVRRVTFRSGESERTVEFRGDEELAAAARDIERRIAAMQGGARIIKITASKGM